MSLHALKFKERLLKLDSSVLLASFASPAANILALRRFHKFESISFRVYHAWQGYCLGRWPLCLLFGLGLIIAVLFVGALTLSLFFLLFLAFGNLMLVLELINFLLEDHKAFVVLAVLIVECASLPLKIPLILKLLG
jgi:hypothetical protein